MGLAQLRERVREMVRERLSVQDAARRLGITESAVRKRARKGVSGPRRSWRATRSACTCSWTKIRNHSRNRSGKST
jgi:hypothetical protein